MHILSPDAPGEDLFWQARFAKVLESRADPILKSLSCVYLRKDLSEYIGRIESASWRAFVLLVERIHRRGRDADLLLDEVDESVPFVRVMVGYYRSTLDYRKGIYRDDVASYYSMDTSTDFGTAIAMESQAWHDQLKENFHAHLQGLWTATRIYLSNEVPAVFYGANTLSPAIHLAVETCNHGIYGSLKGIAESFQWTPCLERQRGDVLRAQALWCILTDQPEQARSYARSAKSCHLPRMCTAHALLLNAKIATYCNNHILSSDQVQTAAEICDTDTGDYCPEKRSVVLGLALQMLPINAAKAKVYLQQYHLMYKDPAMATSHDNRLDAISNVTLSRIMQLNNEDEQAKKTALRAYEVLLNYGYVYWSAMAATEVGRASRGKERQKWIDTALGLLSRYSNISDVYRYVDLQRSRHSVHVTERENEVLAAIREGLTSAEIGNRLHISKRTVDDVVLSLCRKYGVKNRKELIHKTALQTLGQIP